MKTRNVAIILGFIALIAVVSLTVVSCTDDSQGTAQNTENTVEKKATVYDRVIKAGKIRAAYITYPPAVIKDTKTGKLSGTFVETLEQVCKNLGLELEWTEEVGWGAQIEGLMADRYDVVGSPVWANPTRGKLTTMSIPVYYSGIGIYVRKNENRFTNDWTQIDSEKVKIVTIDGETADLIARSQFPKAKRVTLPQLSDISQMFLHVSTNKADVLFAEPFYGFKFLHSQPDSVKNIADKQPIKVLGNCYMFRRGEVELKHMLDVAIEDLLNSGFVDRVIDKYEPFPGIFYRVAHPYRAAK